jgi:ring-1,2-phenylacetyl-CoA epoxidase subunit PaaD
MYTEKEVWQLLEQIPDPEIPVISIVELGIVRYLEVSEKNINITITPTYSGCPAMWQIEKDIDLFLKEKGFEKVVIKTSISPAWTTDWIPEKALEKLNSYGIATPQKTTLSKKELLSGVPQNIKCPICKSTNTSIVSIFGSTACKALYKCNSCKEVFDYFKCI